MTLIQLEYVVAVATYKSFVAAAEKSFVTQPTLSMQIQKLEDELGVKLFDRNRHPIVVTPVGAAIVEQAKKVLSECAKISEVIMQQQNMVSGVFRLAVIPTIAPYIIPPLLTNYVSQFPDVRLQVSEMETDKIVKALRDDEIDAGLVSTPLEESGIREYPIFEEAFVAYFAPDEKALSKRLITPKDIELDKIWLLNEGHCMRNQVINLCSDQVQRLQIGRPFKYESSNVETLRRMVDKNKGFTILPELAIQDFTEEQIERIRYFQDPEPVREVSLITNDHFVQISLLQSLLDEILKLIPEKMKLQKKNRKLLRIQSAKL